MNRQCANCEVSQWDASGVPTVKLSLYQCFLQGTFAQQRSSSIFISTRDNMAYKVPNPVNMLYKKSDEAYRTIQDVRWKGTD